MKKVVFLAHDPGGYDVTWPVYQNSLCELSSDYSIEYYCIGPASRLSQKHAISAELALNYVKEIVKNRKLQCLITGTSWGSEYELQAISICKKAGIVTISLLDYWSNYASRFKDSDGKYIYPDYYVVMDHFAFDEAIKEGVPQNIIRALGHPGLDLIINRNKIKNKETTNNKILFLSQPISLVYNDSLGYTEETALEDCIQVISDIGELMIKYHPKDDILFQQKYMHMSVEGHLLNILQHFNIVIGMSTMGLLHSVLMGIATISYQPNLKEYDYCITNKLGLTKLVDSQNELLLEIKRIAKETHSTIDNRLKKYLWGDGKSTHRVVHFLREVLAN